MSTVERDEEREERISMEIVVDAYTDEEQAMGWYYYLEDRLNCPFKARWTQGTSADEVKVTGMAPEENCYRDMLVEVLYREGDGEDEFSARLSDIEPIDAESETEQAIADWHYWVDRGYELMEDNDDEE